MNSINTNVLSISAQRSVGQAGSSLATSMERLSSGLRINSAKDDAAGLAISDRMTSQVRGLSQAIRNSNDGISMMQTAEGAMQESTNIMQRMRELAVQSANDTNSSSDRVNLQKEVSQLQSELNRIAGSTSFNGKNLLDGSLSNAKFQVGHEADQTINVSIGDARATNMGSNRVSLGAEGGTYLKPAVGAAGTGDVNSLTAATTLSVAGSLGTSDVAVAVGDSARDVANSVNQSSDVTGVEASAQTVAIISNVSAAGAISFDISGQNETDPVRVSAQIDSADDLSNLAKSINDVAGKTGVRAVLSSDNSKIMVENSDGYDITFANQSDTTFDIAMTKVSGDVADGETAFDVSSYVRDPAALAAVNTAEAARVTGAATLATAQATFDASPQAAGDQTTLDNAITTYAGLVTAVTTASGGAIATVAKDEFGTVAGTVEFDSSKSFTVDSDSTTMATADAKSSTLSDIGSVDISTQAGSNAALNVIDGALASVADQRADMGAVMNRFENTISNLSNVVENTEAARSRITDADFAKETAALSKSQVLQQASMAMLAQANQAPQSVLSLLR